MKVWQKIIGLGLTTILFLAFSIGSIFWKLKGAVEGFQTTSGVDSCPRRQTAATPDELPPETTSEKFTFDVFEYQNWKALGESAKSIVNKWDPAGSLTEFDEGAPVPWDMDNKFEDPNDILWGYVDKRCSRSLWERARMRAIFSSANNMDVDENTGQISYVSQWFNGKVVHDPTEIAMTKVAEYFIDYAAEEIIEGIGSKIINHYYGSSVEAYIAADKAATQALKEAKAAAKAQSRVLSKAEKAAIFNARFKTEYINARTAADLREAASGNKFKTLVSQLQTGLTPLDKPTHFISDKIGGLVDRLLYGSKGISEAGRIPTPRKVPVGAAVDAISGGVAAGATKSVKVLDKSVGRLVGAKLLAKGLAKMAGKLLKRLLGFIVKIIGAFDIICALSAGIPVVGQILCALGFVISLVLITVVPQVMQDRADIDSDPSGAECGQQDANNPFNGCPGTHPFSLDCALTNISPVFKQIIYSIPYIGDGMSAFAPYLCSTTNLDSTVFRVSFRPPPYYYDSTLSLYFTDKPNIKDGGANGEGLASPEWTDPSLFKLKKYGTTTKYSDPGYTDDNYHPWVDYSHSDMLDQMADYYYSMSRKNQIINFDGNAEFEYITSFKGCIASSQFSCDVQVELNKIVYNPITNQIISDTPIPTSAVDFVETAGCTFHDRRFYFSIDFTRIKMVDSGWSDTTASGVKKGADVITREVYAILSGLTSANRIAAYRKLFVVVGCTNCNGTAPDVIDNTPDGDFAGEAPVGLGMPDMPFLMPKRNIQNSKTDILNLYSAQMRDTIPDSADDCKNVNAQIRYYGLSGLGQSGSRGTATGTTAVGATDPVILTEPREYTPGLSVKFPDLVSNASTRLVSALSIPLGDHYDGGSTTPFKIKGRNSNLLGITVWSPPCETVAALGTDTNFANPQKGDLVYVNSEQCRYIYWDKRWVLSTNYTPSYTFATVADMCKIVDRPVANDYAMVTLSGVGTKYRFDGRQWVVDTTADIEIKYQLTDPAQLEQLRLLDGDYTYALVGGTTYYKYMIYSNGLERWEQIMPSRDGNIWLVEKLAPGTGAWVQYNPMPRWTTNTGYLNGSTKYWKYFPLRSSQNQRNWAGIQGGLTAFLPLGFGFTGGALATTLDATGAGNKLSCLYQDINKQMGDFVVNGYVVSNQQHFFIIKGPTIKFAPGYKPRYSANKCKIASVNQRVCADRRNIRLMVSKFGKDLKPGTRIKRILSIVPNPSDARCIYSAQSVRVNDTDKQDVPGTEQAEMISVKYKVANPDICSYTIESVSTLDVNSNIEIGAIQADSTLFSPPLTSGEIADLKDPAKNNLQTDDEKRALFLRKNCVESDYLDCSKEPIKTAIRNNFNLGYMKVAGSPAAGYFAKIESNASMTDPLTPKREAVSSGSDPVCIYNTQVTVDRGLGPQTETRYIKFSLEPDPEDRCNYLIKSHDFPRSFFLAPVPRQGYLDLPPFPKMPPANFKRAASCGPEYADCSGFPIMNELIRQYNSENTNRKILRVLKSSTLQLNSEMVCDYQVDMMRVLDDGQMMMDRDTVRFYLEPHATDACLYRIRAGGDESGGARQTGRTIDVNSDIQTLAGSYRWPAVFIANVRNVINGIQATLQSLGMPDTLKTSSADVKTKLKIVQNSINSNTYIRGCESIGTTCKSPDIVNTFIQRYGYDRWPAYPGGQFGSVRTSVIDVRRAGTAGPTQCHIELVEREDSFENYMKEPLPGSSSEFLNKRTFLRQYAFNANNGRVENGKCVVSVPQFTANDIQMRTFDISGEAYGINTTDSSTEFQPGEKRAIKFDQNMISPWSVDVLRQIFDSVRSFVYSPPVANFTSMRLTSISAAVNTRPNTIEYRGFITEEYMDPDFGRVPYANEYVIISASWNESAWNPITGQFTSMNLQPTEFFVMNVNRSAAANQGGAVGILSDGRMFSPPPYLYFDVDLDPAKEISKLTYPIDGVVTSSLTMDTARNFQTRVQDGALPRAFIPR